LACHSIAALESLKDNYGKIRYLKNDAYDLAEGAIMQARQLAKKEN